MQEIWKDIPGYESLYQISNLGNVKSFRQSAKLKKPQEYLLKPSLNNSGYGNVTLYKNASKRKFLVHKLVAEAFIPNENNYPCVNHIDENKTNNQVDNLEWCTYAYNNAYGTARIRTIQTTAYRVHQFTLDEIWIASYLSSSVIEKLLGFSATSIHECCSGKIDYAYGYKWKYASMPNKN